MSTVTKSGSVPAATSSEAVRRQFLDYFASKGHQEVGSASLVPANDPTLLFTNAGMNQFKDVFTGQAKLNFVRAASAQKCVRAGGKHNDLENVGRTARHHTFFEMLGNFSFGDYFKPDAVAFAHELLTRVYAIDPGRLIYTVHHSDDEARQLWKKIAGVGDDRVIGLGDKDNFWAMGETGPCGPCSEIHYFQGAEIPCPEETAGRSCQGPACDCDRWVEIWNLVFMQFEQTGPGQRRPLPKPSVDTGMGLERLCAVLQGVRSNYETDLLRPLIKQLEGLSGVQFDADDYNGLSVSLRAISDHARAAAFLISDGVFPDKTGREYVLRRIMRRAVYHGSILHIRDPFLADLAVWVTEKMGHVYPELHERASLIKKVCSEEELRFRETLDRGTGMLIEHIGKTNKGSIVPGDLAFKLYDTFGFPLDLTRIIAAQGQSTVDEQGFEAAMDQQRRRSEFQGSGEVAVEAVFQTIAARVGQTTFRGYEATEGSARIVALLADGALVDAVGPYSRRVAVVTSETPFYGEQGGQIGDAGTISSAKAKMKVADVKRPISTLYVHLGDVVEGELRVGDTVHLVVDGERRDAVRRNHSATHLLHWALRKVLGEHVTQKGSLVAEDRLRFDYSHFAPLTPEEKRQVEDLVNARVRGNLPAATDVLGITEAKKAGAIAFFGEKYGETVRVVTMGESKEFCGGTHVSRTGDIAFFKITDETGIAQGVRRIEAVTGEGALGYVRKMESELGTAGELLRAGTFDVSSKVAKLQADLREREKEIEKLRRKLASGGGRDLVSEAKDVNGVRVLATRADVADPKALREVADQLRDKLRSGVVVLAGVDGDKIALVAMVTPDLTGRFNAGQIVGAVAREIGGKGGGRADMAQGGGSRPDLLDGALARVLEMVRG
ncbi:MAG TPA: alanine--tRNA ligase [Polyangia bacterium]|jgi:alanyl-tRNA synthetase|nr:alanine--tRNA ligase [Polyangia bacterium]